MSTMPDEPTAPGSLAVDAMPPRVGERPAHERRWRLPLVLFLITCASTFWAGSAGPEYAPYIFYPQAVWAIVKVNWHEGLRYMVAVMAILLAHEMGHFLLTLRHRIHASWPFFIPMPLSFIGTMGAVIGMQASRADRRQLFDIGIAGPLAGLAIAIPVTFFGVQQAKVVENLPPETTAAADGAEAPVGSQMILDDPLLVELMIRWLRPDAPHGELYLNPLLMAGWVGFLITGLNMMPISQLDGGHISYALLGKRAHVLARVFVVAAVIFMAWAQVYQWAVMLVLVMLIGVKHPPTANDQVALGPVRIVLGWTSFLIPVLCFPPLGISII